MAEIEKYLGIYAAPAQFPTYGHSNHGARSMGLLLKWQPESLLDVGCGYNEFVTSLRAHKPEIRSVGVDFACPGADLNAAAKALPFGDKEFDVLTAFDVLEHVPPDEVDATLAEMARVSRRFIVAISYVASVNKWKGETLHPTVKPEDWWKIRLIRAGAVGLQNHGRYITGQWKTPLRIAPNAKVVLVGNGPGVLAHEMGSVIDSFDEVVRFNNFTLEGFEKHTGGKTTLWSAFFRKCDEVVRHPRVFCPAENQVPPASCAEVYNLAAYFYNRTRQAAQTRAFWASGLEREVEPLLASSGLQVASYLLEVVGVKRLHLVGFDHFSKVRSSQHHYWLKQAFGAPKEHAGEVEGVMFDELKNAGRVVYL